MRRLILWVLLVVIGVGAVSSSKFFARTFSPVQPQIVEIPQQIPIATLTLPIPLKGIFTPDVLRSDHAPFWYQGIGAVLVTDTANLRSPYYHQASDTPAKIERSFFSGAAQVVVDAVYNLLENEPS